MKILIAGAGEVGYNLIDKLSKENMEITVIDTDPDILYKLHIEKGVDVHVGNIVDQPLLTRRNLEGFDLFLAITNSDETNMIACQMAKDAGAARTVCRIRQIDLTSDLKTKTLDALGIDFPINPVRLVADEIYQLIQAPNIVETHFFSNPSMKMIGYRIQPYSHIVGKTCKEIRNILSGHAVNPALVHRGDWSLVAKNEVKIEAGDHVYFWVLDEDHMFLRDVLGYLKIQNRSKKIFINGGGHIGMMLAKKLEKTPHQVKIIELDKARSYRISERLQKAMVLNFDGTDSAQLYAEGVGDADYFLSVTDKEEVNLVSCLMAHAAGAKRTICLVKQQELISVLEQNERIHVGISPRLVTARYLTHFIQGSNVDSFFSHGQVEVLEIHLDAKTPCLNTPLQDIPCFQDALVLIIKRGDRFIVPRGHDPLLEGDTIFLVMHRLDRPAVLKYIHAG